MVVVLVFAVGTANVTTTGSVDVATQAKILRCYNSTPFVQVSFDDGGSPAQVNGLLDTLWRTNVRAWFFPTGEWSRANPRLMARIKRDGHNLGNHSYNHPDFNKLSDAQVRWQIANGAGRGLMRPPYGNGAFTNRIGSIAHSLGYNVCYWTVDTRDWSGNSVSDIRAGVRSEASPGGMVLNHMHGRNTRTALPYIISDLRSRGLLLPRLH